MTTLGQQHNYLYLTVTKHGKEERVCFAFRGAGDKFHPDWSGMAEGRRSQWATLSLKSQVMAPCAQGSVFKKHFLIFIYFICVGIGLHVWLYTTFMTGIKRSQASEEGLRSPGTEVTDGCGCWESGPLEGPLNPWNEMGPLISISLDNSPKSHPESSLLSDSRFCDINSESYLCPKGTHYFFDDIKQSWDMSCVEWVNRNGD